MTQTELIVLNFEEIRRRSIKLWNGITPEVYLMRPDAGAMNCLEMVRHVLEGEHLYHKLVEKREDLGDYVSPWEGQPYIDVQTELEFAKPYRKAYMDTLKTFSPEDLSTIEIIRREKGQRRILGDYLQRIAYHEAVHAGQMLSYLRTFKVNIPIVWD
ncbi:DinB family protein [Mucilaginibacter sp. AW1-3]